MTGLDVGGLLGCGLRIELLPLPAAVEHARAQIHALATLLDAPLHPESAQIVADSACLWVGGWPYAPGGGFGPLQWETTPRRLDREVRGGRVVDVPYVTSTASPTAGLPTLAVPALDAGPGVVGRCWNERGELCGTTAGNPLVRVHGGWRRAAPSSGTVPSWLHDTVADAIGAEPADLTRELVEAADDVVVVGALGGVTVLRGSADDVVAARCAALGSA